MYQFINVTAKPQEMGLILDQNSETSKAIAAEKAVAMAAPQMLDVLFFTLDKLYAAIAISTDREQFRHLTASTDAVRDAIKAAGAKDRLAKYSEAA